MLLSCLLADPTRGKDTEEENHGVVVFFIIIINYLHCGGFKYQFLEKRGNS